MIPGLAAWTFYSHASRHKSMCRMNPLLFGRNRLNTLSLPQTLILRVLLFSQAEHHRLGCLDLCSISPFPKLKSNKSIEKKTLYPSHFSFGAVPFLFKWMLGKVTGIQIFYFILFYFPIPREYLDCAMTSLLVFSFHHPRKRVSTEGIQSHICNIAVLESISNK